jgi:energy-coupling factor transporter transmembrane protein EcfT
MGDEKTVLGKPTGLDAARAEKSVTRVIGAVALLTGAALHLVFVPGYPLPVLDGLFTASAAGMVLGAVLLTAPAPRLGWLIGGTTAFLTFLGFILTRTTGLPGILTAIGAWFYPLGIPSLIVEAITFCLAIWALTDRHGVNKDRLSAELRALRPRRDGARRQRLMR